MDIFGPEYADPGSPEYKKRKAALTTTITGAPQAGTAFAGAEKETFGALGASKGVGAEQAALAETLRAQAEGRGPSLAQMQYQRALEGAQAAAASQLASARGLSPAQAQRLMLTRQAGAQAAAASQSAQLRLQEQMAAQAALGNLLGQRRQQELLGGQLAAGLYGTAGGLGMQQSIAQAGFEQAAAQSVAQQAAAEREANQRFISSLIGAGGAALGVGVEAGTKRDVAQMGMEAEKYRAQAAQAQAGSAKYSAGMSPSKDARGRQITPREIPGKAKFKGDTRSNDTVPALLSPGEIVLPRSVAQAEDAPEKSKKFVEAIKKQKRPSPKAYAQALARLAELESRMDAMEALADLEAEEEG